MKKVTARALEKSIAHWDRLANNKAKNGETVHSESCALCDRFNDLSNPEPCEYRGEYCPVRIEAGRQYCYGTPYYDARTYYRDKWHNKQSVVFQEKARTMRDFLIALREVS